MPRREVTIERDIPLFHIPHVVMQGVRTHGEELERVIVRKTGSHFYNVSIRTRPIKREYRKMQTPSPGAARSGDGGESV